MAVEKAKKRNLKTSDNVQQNAHHHQHCCLLLFVVVVVIDGGTSLLFIEYIQYIGECREGL
jgi:hypothetical protein